MSFVPIHRPRRESGRRARDGVRADGLYAALDLGTNNCRLLVAQATRRGFRVVEGFSRPTRLGEGLARTGLLAEAAMARTVDVLAHCAERLARRPLAQARYIATEACRRAANCDAFLARVTAETGIAIEIVSAQEEARLALAGCAALLDRRIAHGLVFDIGGGSTELMWVRLRGGRGERIEAMASLPFGVVTLAERHGAALDTAAGYDAAVAGVACALRPFEDETGLCGRIRARTVQMLGTSGTVTTVAGIHLELPRYERSAVDGQPLSFAAIAAARRRILAMSAAERLAHPCIGPERADLVVAGCAILDAICQVWPTGRLRVADRGVREGMLLGMMRSDAAGEGP